MTSQLARWRYIVNKNAMRNCSAAFCLEVWSSKDRRLSTRYTREMDENSHKKALIQVHLMWIPLIQVLLVWTPLIWKSTHGSLPYANQLMRSRLMRKLHLNSCEVFSWEIVSPQPQSSSHAKSFHLNSCEVFSCGTISTQPMRILLMWNHLIPTHVKPSHVESSHVKSSHVRSSHVESSHVKSSHVKSSHAKSFHLNSCEVFLCDTISSQPMWILLMWNHLLCSCKTFSCEIFSCEIISSQLMWNLLMWNLLMWNLLMWRRITLTHVNCLVSKPTHPKLYKIYKVWTGVNTVTQCKDSDEFRPSISHRQSVGLHVKIPSETLRESIPWHDFCWDREPQNTITSILKPARLYPVL